MPVISTNTAANSALLNLNRNAASQENFLNQLSSGSRINSSADDAAGLAVSGQLQADITTLGQSARNAQQAEALLQTADGALARQGDILQRLKSLATQFNSGTVDAQSRSFINAEYTELTEQLDLISESTEFNGQNLIDGSYNQSFVVGISASDSIDVDLSAINTSAAGLGVSSALSVSNTAILSVELNTTSGTATGTDTLQNLVSGATFGAGAVLTFGFDADGDTAFNDDAGGFQFTFTEGTDGSTVTDLVNFINAQTDVNGDQVLQADFTNGTLTIQGLNLDADGNDTVDQAVTLGLSNTAGTAIDGIGADGNALAIPLNTTGNLVAAATATSAINDDLLTIDNAITSIADARSQIGAFTSAFQFQNANINTQIENLTAARSTIVDVDIAEAQTNFTNAQVLTEAATAALAQANQITTSLLSLLR